jgi:hypothetical protein
MFGGYTLDQQGPRDRLSGWSHHPVQEAVKAFPGLTARGDVNMRNIVTLCAACKKELAPAAGPSGRTAPPFHSLPGETLYSHGICLECGLKWYGAEFLHRAVAGIDRSQEPEGCLQNPV